MSAQDDEVPGEVPATQEAAVPPASGRHGGTAVRTNSYPEPIGVPPTIEWLKVEWLTVDEAYQRSTDNGVSRKLIASIANTFDWRLCAPLVVSRRQDREFAVIDGQHRTMAAQLRGDIPHLPCCVFNYDGTAEEARMFIMANRSRKQISRLDDFHAAVAASDPDAMEINDIVTSAGLSVARNTGPNTWKSGEVGFTTSIRNMVRKHGRKIVSAALVNIGEAFPNQRLNNAGSIFLGLVRILANPPEDLDPDRLVTALTRYTTQDWGSFVIGQSGAEDRARAIQEAMLMVYEDVGNEP
jgi:hypothetical protein